MAKPTNGACGLSGLSREEELRSWPVMLISFTPEKSQQLLASWGKGTVMYVGADSIAGDLEKDLLRAVFQSKSVSLQNFDDQFIVDWRDSFWVATNFTARKQIVPMLAWRRSLDRVIMRKSLWACRICLPIRVPNPCSALHV